MAHYIQNPFVIQTKGKQIRSRTVPGFRSRQREGEDFLLDYEGTALGLPLASAYLKAALVCVCIIVLVLSSRVFYLQIMQNDKYSALAEGNRTKIERIRAPRGIIYDRSLIPLVKNSLNVQIKLIPANLPKTQEERKQVADAIMPLLSADSHTAPDQLTAIRELIETNSANEPVVTLLPSADYETMLSIKLNDNLPGILLEQGIKREYTIPEPTAHVLGYLGKIKDDEWQDYKNNGYYFGDDIGRTGIEAQYQDALRGLDEQITYEIDVRGEKQKIVSEQQLTPGDNLILTIDSDLQSKVYEILTRISKETSGRAAAVALNPSTGEVLSLVSVPSYNNNMFITQDNKAITAALNNENRPLFNRAISGSYPPGSTFKPVVAAAALEEGIVTPRTSFYSSGGLKLNAWFFPDWKAGGHGNTNLNKAIAESVNTYFYYVGGGYEDFEGLGLENITHYADMFGLGSKLGIDLPGENPGFLPTREWKQEQKNESWYIGDTYHVSIGQGDILATPLQIAVYTAAFANGGKLIQPHLIKSITDDAGVVIQTNEPHILNPQIVSNDSINSVRRALRETVLTGSAQSMQIVPVAVSGKTGTAQVGGDQPPHSWFTAFAPYDDTQFVLTVLIENGDQGYNSALVASREILLWEFNNR